MMNLKRFLSPPQLKSVWYTDNPQLDSADTIHQVLMFGSLQEINSLKDKLGKTRIRKLFIDHPKKIYTAPALNLIKNFILKINSPIDDNRYLKYTPRRLG